MRRKRDDGVLDSSIQIVAPMRRLTNRWVHHFSKHSYSSMRQELSVLALRWAIHSSARDGSLIRSPFRLACQNRSTASASASDSSHVSSCSRRRSPGESATAHLVSSPFSRIPSATWIQRCLGASGSIVQPLQASRISESFSVENLARSASRPSANNR